MSRHHLTFAVSLSLVATSLVVGVVWLVKNVHEGYAFLFFPILAGVYGLSVFYGIRRSTR